MISSRRGGEGGQVKNGQSSDGNGWPRERGGGGGGGGGADGIHRNRMSRAIISTGVIRVQTVFQTGVWFCFKQHFGFTFSIPSETCLPEFYCRILSLV